MCDLIIAYIGLHHTLLHLLSLIDTWYLLQWSLPPSPQHKMYLSTQQQAHPLEFFALQMK